MEKIRKIRKLMRQFKLDGYLIPKNDEFFGEYVPDNKDNLKFLSGFNGSYGFALILKNKNYLFVDGRYTLQAKIQAGKKFNIITIPQKIPFDILKNKRISIGFDPKLHTEFMLFSIFKKTKCKLVAIKENFVENIWINKKKNKIKKFYSINDKNVGQSYIYKINQVIKILKKNKSDLQFISSPENISWLINIRGSDTKYTPLPYSYLVLDKKKNISLFCNIKKIDKKIRKHLRNIKIYDISALDMFLYNFKNKIVQIDRKTCSLFYKNIIKKNNKIIEIDDPIYFFKSIKNKVEIKNTIKSHIYDGVALTKFLFWLKKHFHKKKITEISAQEKLLKYRKNNKNFKFLSFPTISGSGPNGAIIHYKANKETNRVLKKGDIYLIDSGGQYNFGTTDVTRTISLENKNDRIKNIFTRVLKGHIAVANFKIKKNTTGSIIDFVARKSLKEINLDYAHGTGHGVGYFLNVHEGPQAISRGNKVKFKQGMIISNEPGYYEKGKFGIRIENLIIVHKKNNLFKFKNLTMAPIDKSLIKKNLLNQSEIKWLNDYHFQVFKNINKYMNKFELTELKKSCSSI